MKAKFLPEFLNRIDDTIVFQPLRLDQIRKIVRIQLDELAGRLAANEIVLEVTDAAIDAIADRGFDPTYGARPLKREIQRGLENRLATELLRNQYPAGSKVRVDFADSDYTFEMQPADLDVAAE